MHTFSGKKLLLLFVLLKIKKNVALLFNLMYNNAYKNGLHQNSLSFDAALKH